MNLYVSGEEESLEKKMVSSYPQVDYDEADTVLILPGGLGSMNDLFHGILDKKDIYLYNKNSVFDSILRKLDYSYQEGRITKSPLEEMTISGDFMELLGKLEEKENGKTNDGKTSQLL